MALDIHGPTRHAAIDDDGEPVIARLPAELGIRAPHCDRIWERFYEAPHLGSPAEVGQWRAELVAIRAAWESRRRAELVRERNIRAQDPEVLDRILAPMLAAERTLAICDDLIAVCDDALAANTGLRFVSD
jgi:hypothetical protein